MWGMCGEADARAGAPPETRTSAEPSTLSAPDRGRLVRCTVALTLTFAEYWLLNYCAFPLFDTVFGWARELSALVGGLLLAALALASFWSVRPVGVRLFAVGVPLGMLAGAACVTAGVALASPALVAVGASFATVGGGLANICAGLACVGLRLRDVALAVAGAYIASFAARWLFALLPNGANLALFAVFPLAALACVGRYVRSFLAGLGSGESPAQMSVTAPRSFLPFGHQVFVLLVVFRVIYGCSLTFGEVGRVPALVPGALAVLVALLAAMAAGCAVLRGRGVPGFGAGTRAVLPDALFKLSVFCSVAGFLFIAVGGASGMAAARVALAASTGCFEILMYYALIAVGARSPSGALPALSWGNAMASWGTIFGASLGRFANHADPVLVGGVAAAIVLVFVAYALVALPRFSFARTIDGVDPASEVSLPEPVAGDDGWDARCARLAETAGLTDREREVFELLAHGRNARFIQDALRISYSTTKTHVSHIYRKLDVHTHQELLDLVERG